MLSANPLASPLMLVPTPAAVPASPVAILPLASPLSRIPLSDLGEFNRLKGNERSRILLWISRLEPLATVRGRDRLWAHFASQWGCKPGTLRNRYYAYHTKDGPDWRGLADGRKTALSGAGLPALFLTFWQASLLKHQRHTGGKEAHRALLRAYDDWRGGQGTPIPGYLLPPEPESWCRRARRNVPSGWTYTNLMRHQPEAYHRDLARQGGRTAARHLPAILTTRRGLKYRERVFCDDQKYDVRVVCPDRPGFIIECPMGFNALDHATGCFETVAIKLAYKDAEDVRRGLTARDFTWFVLTDLMTRGYRTDEVGTTYIFEHGTAKSFAHKSQNDPRSFAEILLHLTGQQVTIDDSGLFGKPSFAGEFAGRSAGNPRFKGPIESAFNLVRNYQSALPGPSGLSPEKAPEESHGMEIFLRGIQRELDKLPPGERAEIASKLRWPALTFGDFCPITLKLYDLINRRRDHDLEGWSYTREEWSFDARDATDHLASWAPMSNFLKLPPETQRGLRDVVKARSVSLSPWEAREGEERASVGKIARLSPDLLPCLLADEWAVPVRVAEDHTIKISDWAGDLHYLARIEGRDGQQILTPGEAYRAHCNPHNPSQIWLMRPDMSYVGRCALWTRPKASERGQIYANHGHRKSIEAALKGASGIRQFAEDRDEDRASMREHNEKLLPGLSQNLGRGKRKRPRKNSADITLWDALPSVRPATTTTLPEPEIDDPYA